jgi:hypothetical protein
MNEPDVHSEAVQDLLHHTVDHFHASDDLAQRVERAARRRRAARWSATGTSVLVAIAATAGVLLSARTGASPTTATSTNASTLPACSAQLSDYRPVGPDLTTRAPNVAEPLVPGSPVAAVLCRYAGATERQSGGNLTGSATITDNAQLARLLAATNAGKTFVSAVNCPESDGRAVILLFVYPRGTADLTVDFDSGCNLLTTRTAMSFGGAGLEQFITGLARAWQPAESNPAS